MAVKYIERSQFFGKENCGLFFISRLFFGAQPSPSLRAKIGNLPNVFFSGYAYPSHKARNKLNAAFGKLEMENLTSEISENVDHIIISREFLKNKKTKIEIFNQGKKLSDHFGICITIVD